MKIEENRTIILKLQGITRDFIMWIFLSTMGSIIILNFFSSKVEYPCKKLFFYSNGVLLIIGILIITLGCVIYNLYKSKSIQKRSIYSTRIENIDISKVVKYSLILLLFGQVYVAYNIYFGTGWDVGGAIIPASKLIALGDTQGFIDNYSNYFSQYPNNILLISIFSRILRINTAIGIYGASDELMAIIMLNCLLNTLACFLVFKTIKSLVNEKFGLIGYVISVALLGISPWVTITYSDSLGLVFPILILFIFTRKTDRFIFMVFKYASIVCLGYVGYLIKPQIIIILIAIILSETIRNLNKLDRKKIGRGIILFLLCVACLFVTKCIISDFCTVGEYETNSEQTFGMTHFLMMGMNPETSGVWNGDDVAISNRCSTSKERKEMNISVTAQRLKDYGFYGYTKLLGRKLLTTFNDGTFAWGNEGGFFKEIKEPKNTEISPRLRNLYYTEGSRYHLFATFEQLIWITVIFLCLVNGIIIKKRGAHFYDSNEIAIVLSIVGLILFTLLFESRARYIYTYVPIFIVMATIGLRKIYCLYLYGKKVKININRGEIK